MAGLIVAAVLALLVALTVRANAQAGLDDDPDPARSEATGVTSGLDLVTSESLPPFDGPCECDPTTIARLAAHGPSLPDVVAAVQRAAGVGGGADPTAGWRRRSRWSSLIPWVTVRAGNTQSWRDVDDPTLLTVSHAAAFDARLGWHLDQLLYDPNEPRFAAFEVARRRERRKLAALASRAYFVWLRAAIATERDTRWQLRLAEAEAELDALTDGWFARTMRQTMRQTLRQRFPESPGALAPETANPTAAPGGPPELR